MSIAAPDRESRSLQRLAALRLLLVLLLGLWLVQAGAGRFTMVLVAFACLIDPRLAWLPAQRRRREVLIEYPVLVAALVALAWLTINVVLRSKGSDVAVVSVLRFVGYVLLWVLALRQLHRLLLRVAARPGWLRDRTRVRSVLCGGAVLLLGMPQLFVALQTHRIAVGQTPDTRFAGAAAHEITIETSSHCDWLRATLLLQPADSADLDVTPIVVVCHGLGANRAMFFDYAELAFAVGCHVCAFDFRAHGHSDGMVTTIGAEEVQDVVDVVHHLRSEGLDGPIVLVGVSMGAATALRAACAVDAAGVFAESSYADLMSMLDARMLMLGPVAPLASTLAWFAARCQLGIDLRDISPRESLAALPVSVPVVLVHAGQDRVIALEEGHRLAAAREGQELHVIAGAGHGGCLWADRARIEMLLRGLLGALAPEGERSASGARRKRLPLPPR